jgi:hypothetical protein
MSRRPIDLLGEFLDTWRKVMRCWEGLEGGKSWACRLNKSRGVSAVIADPELEKGGLPEN